MLVRILSTYHTYELFIENRWLTPVRSQGLFRPVLPKTDLLLYSCISAIRPQNHKILLCNQGNR